MAGETDGGRLFEGMAARFLGDPNVGHGTGFGSNPGLRVGGKIFAMLVRDELVVKLPKERVDELVASGTAMPFDAGKGRPMKEWAAIPTASMGQWEGLAAEAFRFVRSATRGSGRR